MNAISSTVQGHIVTRIFSNSVCYYEFLLTCGFLALAHYSFPKSLTFLKWSIHFLFDLFCFDQFCLLVGCGQWFLLARSGLLFIYFWAWAFVIIVSMLKWLVCLVAWVCILVYYDLLFWIENIKACTVKWDIWHLCRNHAWTNPTSRSLRYLLCHLVRIMEF